MPTSSKESDIEDKSAIVDALDNDWEHDPANPRRWPLAKKWQALTIVSLYTFISPLSTALMGPAVPGIAKKYDITNSIVLAMTISIFFLSYAFAPLLYGPLSEMYGRAWILHIGNLAHLACNIGCAYSPTIGSLIAFRFLTGWAAATTPGIGAGIVHDLFSDRERAPAMAFSTLLSLCGAIVGPIVSGFIVQNLGVKYVFIIMSAFCGAGAVIGIPLLRETYAPVIRMRMGKSSPDLEDVTQAHALKSKFVFWHILWLNLCRPVRLLTDSFILFILALYLALIYGMNFLMFATFSGLFTSVYHFQPSLVGLAFIGPAVGYVVAAIFGAWISNKMYLALADNNGGNGIPEMRMPSVIFGSFFIPVGLFWYGWSAEARIHWIMPIIGVGIFGFGFISAFLSTTLYLVDAFAFTASAVSAAAVFHSLLAFIFPLFGQDMYVRLGYGGGNSLLAGLAIVIGIPFPMWIWYKGEKFRKRSGEFLVEDEHSAVPSLTAATRLKALFYRN